MQLKGPVNLVKTVLRAAVALGVIPAMPTLPSVIKESKKLLKAPSVPDVKAAIGAAPGWLKPALGLAAYAGLRSGEIRALEVRDVDLRAGHIHVRRAMSDDVVETTKSGAERLVPIPKQLVPILAEARRSKLPGARVVLTPKGHTPNRQRLLSALTATLRKANLPAWSLHSFRHFFCSELVRMKTGVEAVRRLAGHTNLATTARYLHATDEDLKAARDAFAQHLG